MKVMYFTAHYTNYTGSQRATLEWAKRLPAEIDRVAVFPGEGRAPEEFRRAGLDTIVEHAPAALHSFQKRLLYLPGVAKAGVFLRDVLPYTLRLWRLLRAERPDLIHADGPRAVLLVGWAARLARVPVVMHLHGENVLGQRSLLRRAAEALSTTVAVCADALRSSVSPGKPCRTIYYGIDPEDLARARSKADPLRRLLRDRGWSRSETLCLATTSSLVPFKGHHHLLRALEFLFTRRPELRSRIAWLIFGDAATEEKARYRDYLVEAAAVESLDANLFWMEWQDDSLGWIEAADLVVLPTVQREDFRYPDGTVEHLRCSEGFPLTILEAMMAGRPVIASDVAGVREAVADGETGWVIPPGDPVALSHAIEQAFDGRTELDATGARAAERVRGFTRAASVDAVVQLYHDVICHAGAGCGDAAGGRTLAHAPGREP